MHHWLVIQNNETDNLEKYKPLKFDNKSVNMNTYLDSDVLPSVFIMGPFNAFIYAPICKLRVSL